MPKNFVSKLNNSYIGANYIYCFIFSNRKNMTAWKHNRDYYLALAKQLGWWAVICFCLFLMSVVIFIIDISRTVMLVPVILLLIILILLLRLRKRALKDFNRAPAIL